MKELLAPHFNRKIHGIHILWFKPSNKYLLLNDINNSLLSCFLKSTDFNEFYSLVHDTSIHYNLDTLHALYSEFKLLLKTLNTGTPETISLKLLESSNSHFISVYYQINGELIKVCYQSEFEKEIIHPQFSHLEIKTSQLTTDINFYIKSSEKELELFKNNNHLGTYNKSEYHLLQGKFAMELLCVLTDTEESDWLGTFHASTISNTKEAVMLVGKSGQGKSTLATILMAKGFNLIADDFSPMLAKSQKVSSYPAAISVKPGAFDLLEELSDRIVCNNQIHSNIKKGPLKYVQPLNTIEAPIRCDKIILVAYKAGEETVLEQIGAEDILEILIPDSWLSPIPKNAEHFLDWLETCQFYKLTYSDSNSVVSKFKSLLEEKDLS